MGKRIQYREMKKQLREWVEDEAWLIQEEYIKDPLYYSCVKDIFENKAFQSMNHYIQHGSTTTRPIVSRYRIWHTAWLFGSI